MNRTAVAGIAFVAAVAAASALAPARFWGLSSLRFYPPGLWILGAALFLVSLSPPADRALARCLSGAIRRPLLTLSLGTALSLAWCSAAPIRFPILGDQLLWLRSLSGTAAAGHIMEPGSFELARWSGDWIALDESGLVRGPAVLSILLMAPFSVLGWFLSRSLGGGTVTPGGVFVWLVLLCGPWRLFFHGYVESYPVLTVLLMLSAWLAVRDEAPRSRVLAWGSSLAGAGAHLQGLGAAFVIGATSRGRGLRAGLLGATGGAVLAAWWWHRSALARFPAQDNPLDETLTVFGSFLSGSHILGTANILLLIGGPVLFLFPAGLRDSWREPGTRVLAGFAGLGILGLLMVHLSLGALRDWDLFTPYLLFGTVLLIHATMRTGGAVLPRGAAAVLVLILLHGAAWVHVDTAETRGWTRAETIFGADSQAMDPRARARAADDLAFLARGDHELAARWYGRAAIDDPWNWRLHHNQATELLAAGRFSEAEAAFAAAVELSPARPEPYASLGSRFLETDRPAEALAVFDRGLAAAGVENRLLAGRVGALFALERFGEAEAVFDSCLARMPGHPDLLRYAAQNSLNLGDATTAQARLARLVRLAPGDSAAWRSLEAVARVNGDSVTVRWARSRKPPTLGGG